jgi:hypothetical protein
VLTGIGRCVTLDANAILSGAELKLHGRSKKGERNEVLQKKNDA